MLPRPELLEILACPRDQTAVRVDGSELSCVQGHRYPIVDGVPVMLTDDQIPTIGLTRDSLLRARDPAHADARAPELYLESVGISDVEKDGVLALHARGGGAIDPVVSYLIGATNGHMYAHLIGKLSEYPIPEIRIGPGQGRRLLDIGCSWGRWSIAATRKGYRVVGLDPSLGAVMAARRVARQLGLTVDHVVGDARYLPFLERSFDACFSYSVLQHFAKSDARMALREIGRVVRLGGTCLVQMANMTGVRSMQHQIRRRFRAPQAFEVRYWTVPGLRKAFEEDIGPSRLEVDGYFGLGMQASDAAHMRPLPRAVLLASTTLTGLSKRLQPMRWLADSVYIRSSPRA